MQFIILYISLKFLKFLKMQWFIKQQGAETLRYKGSGTDSRERDSLYVGTGLVRKTVAPVSLWSLHFELLHIGTFSTNSATVQLTIFLIVCLLTLEGPIMCRRISFGICNMRGRVSNSEFSFSIKEIDSTRDPAFYTCMLVFLFFQFQEQ